MSARLPRKRQSILDSCRTLYSSWHRSLFKTEATDHAAWIDAGKATGNSKIEGVLMPDVSNISDRAKTEPWWADNMVRSYTSVIAAVVELKVKNSTSPTIKARCAFDTYSR